MVISVMENSKSNKCQLFFEVLILLLGTANAVHYRLVPENEEIYTACPNQPSNVKHITEFFDVSELQTKDVGDKILVSGNVTSTWNFNPTDHIIGSAKMYRYDRREWDNAFYSISFTDLCSEIFDERKHLYKFWMKHVVNLQDIKAKCVLRGVKFIHEPFALDMNIDIAAIVPTGRHKVVLILKTIDKEGQIREPTMCLEIIGEVIKG
ncbi:uncharacterized protein LOC132798471 isoform X1 [Drosophila nasuta]|uniref:uncharacterized protein LOC132798471 isoform X1 n=1 Tax=Drosophila nasuta TaxID=42062 RepID=UPI00295EA631|nr:uncharacterized protein LOC132798471 isoform X1 [Drosophila nasuta]